MTPKTKSQNNDHDVLGLDEPEVGAPVNQEKQPRPPADIVWANVINYSILHLAALNGVFLLTSASLPTLAWSFAVYMVAALGVTAGAHRLWAHRSYKATFPLRVILAIANATGFQNSIYEWARDHRVHHKYSESDADPHNARRGFFFSHVGWLLVKKHPDVKVKGARIDLSDLKSDPVVMFQKRYFYLLGFLCNVVVPTAVPVYCWSESLSVAFFVSCVLRYVISLHATWLVNSAAHKWGNRPYDEKINPAENMFVCVSVIGEGFHNYHHTFPQDYSTSEYGWHINPTTMFIDVMSWIGLAYDRKKISKEAVLKRRSRTGDMSH